MIFEKPIAIVDGLRSPIMKSETDFTDISADDLATTVVREVLARNNIKNTIQEVIVGNVAQPVNAQNIARVISLKAGLDIGIPAVTVHRNCASGMEAITQACDKITLGGADTILAAGVESMSNIPLLYPKVMKNWLWDFMKAKSLGSKLKMLSRLRPNFFKPIISLQAGLTDPICNLLMGQTAENLANQFNISRHAQDDFALKSHQKASAAIDNMLLDKEVMPIITDKKIIDKDNGVRANLTIDQLQKLKPYFDKKLGSVTIGTSSQISDGAAAVVLMEKEKAVAQGYNILGYLKGYAYAGCEPSAMGLGPVYATAKLLSETKISMEDIDLIEMNEAFAAQVLANIEAFYSKTFAKKYLNRTEAVGLIDENKLNIHGGAIALGHPLGMTGTRLVLTLLHKLKQQGVENGLATLCVGGGQGASILLQSSS